MEWWVILLLILVIIFTIFVIWFSFIYPNKIKKNKIKNIMANEPEKIVQEPNDIKYFTNFKYINIENNDQLTKEGIAGFYVNASIKNDDYIYPIYIVKTNNINKTLLELKNKIDNNDESLNKLFDYLNKTKKTKNKIHLFYTDDFDIKKYDYWMNIFEINEKGLN